MINVHINSEAKLLPYGMTNFETIINENYYYVDKRSKTIQVQLSNVFS